MLKVYDGMKYYSQYNTPSLFDLEQSLSGLSKSNRWVKLGDSIPWNKVEEAYNKRLENEHHGAGNKPARMVVGALIIKHVEGLSDEKTIQEIQENPYMQYLLGLPCFTEKPVFASELFVLIRRRLDPEFFNMLTLILSKAQSGKAKSEKDDDGNEHGGILKTDATCCDAEVRYPTDCNLLEDGSKLTERLLEKFCKRYNVAKPKTHRTMARAAFIVLTKKKRKSKKLIEKTKLIQIRCLQADFQTFLDFMGRHSTSFLECFSRHDYKCLQAGFKMFDQQKMMFEKGLRTCADRIISIYQPHLRPIVRGKAKAKVEFGAKIGASIVKGYTYVDHFSWDAYNESVDLTAQIELYQKRFDMLPSEVQADKLYLGRENRNYLKEHHIECFNHPLGRPSKEENDKNAQDKKRALGERNEIEATFGTSKRVYRANNIRAKLPDTADTWIGACFFAKNVMKFLREFLRLFFQNSALTDLKKTKFDRINIFPQHSPIYYITTLQIN